MSAGHASAAVEGYAPRSGRGMAAAPASTHVLSSAGKRAAAERAAGTLLKPGAQHAEALASLAHLPAERLDASSTAGPPLAARPATAAASPTGSPEPQGAATDSSGSANSTAVKEGGGRGGSAGHATQDHDNGSMMPAPQLERPVLVSFFHLHLQRWSAHVVKVTSTG